MRSLQYGLGKRSPLFVNFNAGVNLSGFSPTVFSNPATAPVTLTSSAAAPVDTPAAYFTSSVNNPNTAYSFDSSLNKPWTPGSANSANLAWGTFTDNTSLSFGTDGNLFSEGSLNPHEMTEAGNRKTEAAAQKAAAENAKLQEQNMQNWLQALFKIFQVIGGSMAGGAVPPTMAAAPSTNNAPAAT